MTGSGMAARRRLLELAREGTIRPGLPAARALVEVPVVVAELLASMSGEPVRACLAVGAEEVAALEAYLRSRPPFELADDAPAPG